MLTIIILTYNRPDYLRECIASVMAQTMAPEKIIILDNASTVDYSEVIEKLRPGEIEYIRQPQNIGSTGNYIYACNLRLKSKYTMIFHDDDLLYPKSIELMIRRLEANDSLAWVGSTISREYPSPRDQSTYSRKQTYTYYSQSDLALALINGLPLCTSSVVFRTANLNNVNVEELVSTHSIIFDRPMLLEMLYGHTCCIISGTPLVYYRLHPSQDSKTGPLTEDNLLALAQTYKTILSAASSKIYLNTYLGWSSYSLPLSWLRLNPQRRRSSSLLGFLSTARQRALYTHMSVITHGLLRYIKHLPRYVLRRLKGRSTCRRQRLSK